MTTRRTFLGTTLGAAAASVGTPWVHESALSKAFGTEQSKHTEPIRKIAIVTTVWTYQSHAQHMGDRFLVGYPRHGRWHRPPIQVVSLYVDQKPEGDLSAQRAKDHGFTVYPTIAEALRRGGSQLAVDGVVIIAEHGNYPSNAKGQIQYPRYEFFQEAVRVFEKDGRSGPVFNVKHLSWSWQKAKKMVEDSQRLKFPFLAGSS
ncbi:MAG: twin-arginine translocation signal domain-containing protein, partial [Planctomyces sp.]